MRKKAVQQGRSERRGESYSLPYVERLSDARTPLADFFRILLVLTPRRAMGVRASTSFVAREGSLVVFCPH